LRTSSPRIHGELLKHLTESGITDLESWQQEIREYARNGEVASFEAEQKLRAWAKIQGLIDKA
jgi:hypothetical protein